MTHLPPGPRISSPLGIVPDFARDPLGLVMQAFRSYGDCALLPGPLGQNVYLLNEPDLIHAVLVKHAEKIEKPAPLKWIFRSSFGNGLFFSEGNFWRRQRKLAQPAFHHKRLQSYAEGMVQRAQQMLANWHGLATDVTLQKKELGKAARALKKADADIRKWSAENRLCPTCGAEIDPDRLVKSVASGLGGHVHA